LIIERKTHLQRDQSYNLNHSAHDYAVVFDRWSHLAKKGGFTASVIADIEGYKLLGIQTAPANKPIFYLSAGIHGDEPAGVWALLEWCETNLQWLKSSACHILPCINPWGFVRNKRCGPFGNDLNRTFQSNRDPFIAGWKMFIGLTRFRRAVTLHEDFDARGIYAYQLGGKSISTLENALKYCAKVIPLEARTITDGMTIKAGVVKLSRRPKKILGVPEARYLFNHHAEQVFIFESPSEFSFYERVKVQKIFLGNVL
jgi:hypothetical protein